MDNELKSMKSFEAYLSKFCCANCKFFIKKKCTEANAREHMKEKRALKGAFLKLYNEGIGNPDNLDGRIEMLNELKKKAENIDEVFLCEQFE